MEKITHTQKFLPQTRAVGNNRTGGKATYKRREMSLMKNLTLKKRTKVAVGTFFQLSGATLEILVSLSTKKNSLSDQRREKRKKL